MAHVAMPAGAQRGTDAGEPRKPPHRLLARHLERCKVHPAIALGCLYVQKEAIPARRQIRRQESCNRNAQQRFWPELKACCIQGGCV